MSEPSAPQEPPVPAPAVPVPAVPAPAVPAPAAAAVEATPPPPKPGKGSRIAAIVVLLLIVFSLLWYFVSDRLTPHTSQARVQAFVIPVASEVAGNVVKVYVKNNDEVQRGQALFDIDPTNYRIAFQRSRSDYETVRRSVNASGLTVEAAKAAVQAANAQLVYAQQDAKRMEQIYAEDSGAVSLRRVQNAQATRVAAISQVKAAEADLQKAIENAGERGDNNAQLISARSAVEKAELDLKRAHVVAPARGRVTDLQTDVGKYAQPGAAAMTLIAVHDLWIDAQMTENNLGNIKPGDPVDIVLDVMPGEVLKGRVRSVGGGVGSGQQAQAGALPKVENSRDWLRQAQRFPVAVEFEPAESKRLGSLVRIGGQANVLVYTGDHAVMNWLGSLFMSVISYLSYLY